MIQVQKRQYWPIFPCDGCAQSLWGVVGGRTKSRWLQPHVRVNNTRTQIHSLSKLVRNICKIHLQSTRASNFEPGGCTSAPQGVFWGSIKEENIGGGLTFTFSLIEVVSVVRFKSPKHASLAQISQPRCWTRVMKTRVVPPAGGKQAKHKDVNLPSI